MKTAKNLPYGLEAIKWTGRNVFETLNFVEEQVLMKEGDDFFYINTKDGNLKVAKEDWIIKSHTGVYNVISAGVFENFFDIEIEAIRTITIERWGEIYGDFIIQNPNDKNEMCGHENAEWHKIDREKVLDLEKKGNQVWTKQSDGQVEWLSPGWATVNFGSWIVTNKPALEGLEEVTIWSDKDQEELDLNNAIDQIKIILTSYCEDNPDEAEGAQEAFDLINEKLFGADNA